MRFGYCGVNYRKANQDIRDKISFTDSKKEEMFGLLHERGIYQSMILSTCNRSEVFYFYEKDSQKNIGADCFKLLFSRELPEKKAGLCSSVNKAQNNIYKHCANNILDMYIEQGFEKEAIEYLFRVTAGLESMVLGEDQILGQVREAMEFSRTMGYSKKEMNRVVTDAIACAKKIKTLYKISEIPLSVGYVGVKELNGQCSIRGKKVLLIGSGQTAGLALKYICEYQPLSVTVCSRTREGAKRLTEGNLTDGAVNIQIRDLSERYNIAGQSDIVVSATSSPHLIIEAEKCNINKKIYMLDLAAPRDIDVNLKDNSLCTLINIDMIGEVVERNKSERKELSEKAASVIEGCAEETFKWLRLTSVDGTIESLQKRCEDIVNDSFSYINRKLSLSEHEQMVIERTLKASLKRLLREPIVELKSLEEEEQELYKRTVEKLFHI